MATIKRKSAQEGHNHGIMAGAEGNRDFLQEGTARTEAGVFGNGMTGRGIGFQPQITRNRRNTRFLTTDGHGCTRIWRATRARNETSERPTPDRAAPVCHGGDGPEWPRKGTKCAKGNMEF